MCSGSGAFMRCISSLSNLWQSLGCFDRVVFSFIAQKAVALAILIQ
jgi:hypothetical protein